MRSVTVVVGLCVLMAACGASGADSEFLQAYEACQPEMARWAEMTAEVASRAEHGDLCGEFRLEADYALFELRECWRALPQPQDGELGKARQAAVKAVTEYGTGLEELDRVCAGSGSLSQASESIRRGTKAIQEMSGYLAAYRAR